MRLLKHLLSLSFLCSLVLFTNCGEDSDDPVANDTTNNTNDGNTDNSSQDTVTYTLILTPSEGGIVTPESGTYNENESVALLAIPDSTFVFVNWTGSSTSTDNPLSVSMDADKSYTANFTKKQYPLTILIEGEGLVSEEIITNGRVEDYDVGTLVQLTADPSEGWKFDQWIELDINTNPIEVSITDSIILTARFYVPIDSVSIIPSALQMILGAIDTLKADIYPSNISDTLNWISSDERIATVTQEGIVTALAKGETIITVVTAKDSITNSVKVVVSADGDQDGVIDDKDTCADTLEGATVDTNGCADSQKDTDDDGVKDDMDTCVDTSEGATVDTHGCADSQKDTDGDGVKDDMDTCVDTPEGAIVDTHGCADSQKDTDGDGVKDDMDTCVDTPEGATVDANGCADSQKDTDGDGVKDDKDTCADTSEGSQVDLNGCPMGSVWTGTILTFSKLDNTDPSLVENQDRITENLWITRNNVEGGQIYNAVSESASSKNTSPAGTAWAEGDIADYATLNYTPFRTATGKPKNAVGKTYVVHLIEDNIYLSIKMLSWSSKKAGGFSYERSTE
jgi:uncharacterized repeat protein (TIGR02543 family)